MVWTSSPEWEQTVSEQATEVGRIWQEALSKPGNRMFNGTLLSYLSHQVQGNRLEMTGHFVDFKSFYAQYSQGVELGIKPVSVSGMIVATFNQKKQVLFARRADWVTQNPGQLELVPSGGLDRPCALEDKRVDYQQKLREEFTEETGLEVSLIEKIQPMLLVYDDREKVYDICCVISLNQEDTLAESLKTGEYSQFEWVPVDDLAGYVNTRYQRLVPTSIAICQAYVQSLSPIP